MSVQELRREFEWLANTSGPTVAAWRGRHPVLAGCEDPHDVLAAIRADPDPVLRALLREVKGNCPIAGRTVLQALLPKMIVLAGRDRNAGTLDDYLCALWLRIADYPLDRRPHRIAANLALDTMKTVRAERGDGVLGVDRAVLQAQPWLRGAPARGPDARRLLRFAVDRGFVDPVTHAVLASVYADGLSREEAAQRYRMTPTTIRRRCHRGLKTLAAHAPELRAVA